MATTLAPAIDSKLSRDGFKLAEKIENIAGKFAARGFSQPPGPMYSEIDDLCLERMTSITDTAIAVFKEHCSQSSNRGELESELVTYLQSRLNSVAQTALHTHMRPASQSASHTFESRIRSLIAKAKSS